MAQFGIVAVNPPHSTELARPQVAVAAPEPAYDNKGQPAKEPSGTLAVFIFNFETGAVEFRRGVTVGSGLGQFTATADIPDAPQEGAH